MKPTNRGGQVQGGVRLAQFFTLYFRVFEVIVKELIMLIDDTFADRLILLVNVKNLYLN